MTDKKDDLDTPLNQLVKYFSKVGKVGVTVDGQVATIEWELKLFTHYKIEVNGGETTIRIRRFSDSDYITIKPRKGYCLIYVSSWLYFDRPVYPEIFVLDDCRIVIEKKKKLAVTFTDVQYKDCKVKK
jgi:hypothetical protein